MSGQLACTLLLFLVELVAVLIPAHADDWPGWRGAARNGLTGEESGYRGGAWELSETWSGNFGEGSSSPIVAAGRLYVMGWREGKEVISCVNSGTGKVIWSRDYAAPRYGRFAQGDQGFYSGPSSTPEYDAATGFLYTLGIDGELRCWDTRKSGAVVWQLNLYERYNIGKRPQVTPRQDSRRDYGYTSSPLVQRELLIAEVGAEEGNLMAFNKRTGERKWASENRDPAGHTGGPAPITIEGVQCAAVITLKGLLVARIDSGITVATYPWDTDFANVIASPAIHQNEILITSGYNRSAMAKLRITLKGAQEVWRIRGFSPVCTPVIHDGFVYWAARGLWCVELNTGEVKWNGGRFGDAAGSCIVTADDRIVVWANEGDLALAESAKRARQDYKELAWKGGICRSEAWPHLALADGRLYCKDRTGKIKCLSIADGLPPGQRRSAE